MAVTRNSYTDGGQTSGYPATKTVAHTVSAGSNQLLLVFVTGNNLSMTDPTVTYNSVSMTKIAEHSGTGIGMIYIFALLAPDSGSSYNCVVTQGATTAEYIGCHVVAYDGANQGSEYMHALTFIEGNANTASLSTTGENEFDDSFIVGFGFTQASSITAGTGTTDVTTGTSNDKYFEASPTVLDRGEQTLIFVPSSTTAISGIWAAVIPATATKTEIEQCADDDSITLWHMNGSVGSHSIDFESGSSQYANVAGGSKGSDYTALTVECHAMVESAPSSGNHTVLLTEYSNDAKFIFSIYNNGGTIEIRFNGDYTGGTAGWINASGEIPDYEVGRFYHFVGVWDQANSEVRVYCNGIELDATANDNTSFSNVTSNGITMGSQDTPGDYFDGKVDDMRLWSDVRTDEEIRANIFTELTGSEAGLVSLWKLDGDLTDSAGGNDLTGSGSPTYSTRGQIGKASDPAKGFALTETATPTSATGFMGDTDGAYQLTAANSEYLQLSDNAIFDFSTDFTLEGWFYWDSLPSSGQVMTMLQQAVDASRAWSMNLYNDSGTYKIRHMQTNTAGSWDNDHLAVFTPSVDTWYYVCMTYDLSAGESKIYINGVLISIDTGGPTAINNSSADVIVGSNEGSGSYFDGRVDEIQIGTRLKSAAEIFRYYIGTVSAKFYPSAGAVTPCDGPLNKSDGSSWANARDAATADTASATATNSDILGAYNGATYFAYRMLTNFNTISLPEDSTIEKTAGSLSFYTSGAADDTDTTTINVVQFAPASTDNLVVGDFDSVVFADGGSLDLADITGAGYFTIPMNSTGLGYVNSSAITSIGAIIGTDLNDTTPTGLNRTSNTQTADGANSPYLWVEYNAAAATGSTSDFLQLF